MALTVIQSDTPVVPDTLPALKTRWYRGGPRIYTMARFYFLQQSLQLTFTVFERTPPAGSRAGFAFGGAGNAFAAAFLAPEEARLALLDTESPPAGWQAAERDAAPFADTTFFTGQDEQGWYWGANLDIGREWLADAGVDPAPGAAFAAALAKYTAADDALGLSFQPPDGTNTLDRQLFTAYTITR